MFAAFNCYAKQTVSKNKYDESAHIVNNWNKNFASPDCGAKIGIFTTIFITQIY